VRLGDVARAQHNDQVTQLARKLELHARSEEELFHPAAVLVGDLVRARLQTNAPGEVQRGSCATSVRTPT
jgi:hypothetical protein